jgi:diguanylate cyclase (GGDEF)-like protein
MQQIKNDINTAVALGFMAILALMFSLVFVSLVQLHSINESMQKMVEVTNIKTAAANDMRDAIHLRSESLKNMQLMSDIFDRDEEHLRFTSYAGKYRSARETFSSFGMDREESELLEELKRLTRSSQPYNDKAASLLMGETPATEIEAVIKQAAGYQQKILAGIEALITLERNNTEQALKSSRVHYSGTRILILALAGIALLFSLLLARTIITRVSSKNRQLAYQASHDKLTGLINRHEFECRVERAIGHARTQLATHALLYLDLDQFKVINDTCGHAAGDELLQQLAHLLLSTVRRRDTLGRLGGDEFGMLLENCPLDRAVSIANELLAAIDGFQYSWDENIFTLGASIGAVPIDRSTADLASTMSAADSACYIAKESGRNQVQIAHLGDRRLQERHGEMQWVSRLKKALDEDRFVLYFQPIVPCANHQNQDKQIEILLRMIDEDGAIISPASFLPASEKYNIVTSIDRWVISHTMEWLSSDPVCRGRPATISINLSGQSICNREMMKFIMDEMDNTGVDPGRIVFEVTETSAISNITAATSFMLTLRGCGFRFSLDDFGSGLYSFAYLKKLPVDFLKIDGAFVRDILSDPVDHAMVKSINKLGHLLGMETIAEFVETFEVAEELRRMGVNYAQGYAYAKPQPLSEFARAMGPHLVVVSSR